MQDRDKLEIELLELRTVVDTFDGSLRRLAMGDVQQQIQHPLPRGYDGLRKDFNRGLASVGASLDTIIARSRGVRLEADELHQSLKRKTEEEVCRQTALAGKVAETSSAADTARRQSAHVEHIQSILYNARVDMRRPKETAAQSAEQSERACQSLAQLKSLTDEVRAMLREASLLALNGGINAAHTGLEGEEALGAAKNLHALTRKVSSTIEALAEASESAVKHANAAATASGQTVREFDALDLYTEALDTQLSSLGQEARQHAVATEDVRAGLAELARGNRPLDDAQPSPEMRLSSIDRAIAEIDRQASRYMPVRVMTPPVDPTPGSSPRSHLRLVKS
ncbi:methyl-accepting chemotaxis domain-containing protein [Rhizobium halophilum]|uniref:hypothetical protein n=1 Tax=Rhizobium halophilum TaxID=2846852 RepID=UPI001EFEC983|nr:hypothetical protein [Rhizobium halophilum]MCF6367729.1 hypothetical protein [Rhizobium halophilum]